MSIDHCCGLLKCTWRGSFEIALIAPHPFMEGKTIYGCPECGEIGVYVACQESDCTYPGTTRADTDEKLCEGPFYCDYHWDAKQEE